MNQDTSTIYVVDDDQLIRTGLARLLGFAGFAAETFASAGDFLERVSEDGAGCVILDFALPDLDGLQVQDALAKRGCLMPIIFLTGRADVPTSVTAMKRGAAEFLMKPVDKNELIGAVRQAFERCEALRRERHERAVILGRYASLTPRERDVLTHLLTGQMNKQIAADLGTLECTIKAHRAQVMRKMQTRTLATLVRLAVRAGISPTP